MSKEKRLGRGLEALFGQLPVRNDSAASGPDEHRTTAERIRPSAAAESPRGCPPPADFFEHPPAAADDRVATDRHRPNLDATAAAMRPLADRSDRQQSASAAAGIRSPRNCNRWPKAFPPTGCCSRSLCESVARALPTHRRRAAASGGAAGRLDRRAGEYRRSRRPPNGRTGDRRKPAAQRSESAGKSRLVPTLFGAVRLHAG